jgi:hypothetical protein
MPVKVTVTVPPHIVGQYRPGHDMCACKFRAELPEFNGAVITYTKEVVVCKCGYTIYMWLAEGEGQKPGQCARCNKQLEAKERWKWDSGWELWECGLCGRGYDAKNNRATCLPDCPFHSSNGFTLAPHGMLLDKAESMSHNVED